MLKEQAMLLGIGALVIGGGLAGAFAVMSGGDDVAEGVTAEPSAPSITQPVEPPQSSETLRAQQLARMIANDRSYVGAQGFRIVDSQPRATGQCTEDATIDRSGWYGGDTGLLYQAEKGGEQFTVCFSHDNEEVTRARAMPLNPAPVAPAQPSVNEADAMLSRMFNNDAAYLDERGFSIVGEAEAFGNCEDHGSDGVYNDGTGFKGSSTGILYTITDGEGFYWACAEHSNEQVSNFIAAPK